MKSKSFKLGKEGSSKKYTPAYTYFKDLTFIQVRATNKNELREKERYTL
jgi:hypothetical protein